MGVVVGVRAGLTVDHQVVAGEGARFDRLGGPGLFAALGARLVAGTSVELCANLPDDEPRFGRLFAELGIGTGACLAVPEVPRLWILNSAEGRRILPTRPPGGVELETAGEPDEEIPLPRAAALGAVDALLDSSPEDPAGLAPGVLVGVDPHQLRLGESGLDYLARVSPPGSVILPSRVQLRLVDPDVRVAARRIRDELGRSVVARLDAEGMLVLDAAGGPASSVHDRAVRVVETTGAGDASAAAIVAALAAGHELPTAAAFGASVARLALADWGHDALLAEPLTDPFTQITIEQDH